jgi:hypothetical protein
MRQFFIIILTGTVVCFSIFPTVTVAQDQSIIASGALVVAGSGPVQPKGNPFAFTTSDVQVNGADDDDSKGSKGSKPKDGKKPTAAANERTKSNEPRGGQVRLSEPHSGGGGHTK